MTHRAGIGFSMPEYDEDKLTRHREGMPQIDTIIDLLQFIEKKVSPVDGCQYSNAGMLLIGLAIEQAYENKFGEHLDFNAILEKYLIYEIGMPSFSTTMPANAKRHDPNYTGPFNSRDCSIVENNTISTPSGSAWINAQDLAKLGIWICQEYSKHVPNKLSLKEFLEKYGQESYHVHNETVVHPGTAPFASSYFSLSLKTGALLVILSNQPCIADDLAMMIRSEIFRKPDECTSTVTPTPFV